MSEILPTLHWLDKEMVEGETPGKKFYDRCRRIEENSKKGNDDDILNQVTGE
jgi:hypothetical protein